MKTKELSAYLKKNTISCAMFFNFESTMPNPNYFYLSEFDDIGCFMIFAQQTPLLLVSKMSESKTEKMKIRHKTVEGSFIKEIKAIIGKSKRIGIDGSNITFNFLEMLKKNFKGIKFVDVSKKCEELRRIKTEEEIKIMKKGFAISDEILDRLFNNMKKFKTELDAVKFLKEEAAKRGCEMSFDPIVASAKNSANVHHTPGNNKITKGFCMVDFGIKYNDYCTDTTRMVYIGTPTKKEKDDYTFMLNLQNDLVENAKKGVVCSELSKYCDRNMGKYSMPHSLGHGVGLLVHESPCVNTKDDTKLEKNMIITIEPGIYISKNHGIRIEDTLLITDRGNEILSKISKKLRMIK